MFYEVFLKVIVTNPAACARENLAEPSAKAVARLSSLTILNVEPHHARHMFREQSINIDCGLPACPRSNEFGQQNNTQ